MLNLVDDKRHDKWTEAVSSGPLINEYNTLPERHLQHIHTQSKKKYQAIVVIDWLPSMACASVSVLSGIAGWS